MILSWLLLLSMEIGQRTHMSKHEFQKFSKKKQDISFVSFRRSENKEMVDMFKIIMSESKEECQGLGQEVFESLRFSSYRSYFTKSCHGKRGGTSTHQERNTVESCMLFLEKMNRSQKRIY